MKIPLIITKSYKKNKYSHHLKAFHKSENKKHFLEEVKEWNTARLENASEQMSDSGRRLDHVRNI